MKVKRNVVEANYQDDDRRVLRLTARRVDGRRRHVRYGRVGGWGGALRPAPRRPRPGRRLAAGGGAGGAGRAPVRVLRARAVLHGALRLLRLQHLHRRGARRPGDAAGASRATYAAGRDRGGPPGPPGAGRTRPPGLDGLLRRRHADPAAVGRPGGGRGRDRRRVRAGARRGGHHGVQPRQRHPGRPRGAAGRRLQPDLLRHAVRRRRTCSRTLDRTHDPRRVPDVVAWARAAGLRAASAST